MAIGKTSGQDTTNYSDTVVITSKYDVDIDYPFFTGLFVGIGKVIDNVIDVVEEPEHLFYEERVHKDTCGIKHFTISLVTDEKRQWFWIIDDTVDTNSFTSLPSESRIKIFPEMKMFVARLKSFLENPLSDHMVDTFYYNDRSMTATVIRNTDIDRDSSWSFSLTTRDLENPDERYIDAEIEVTRKYNYAVYRRISAEMMKNGVKITVTLNHVNILTNQKK